MSSAPLTFDCATIYFHVLIICLPAHPLMCINLAMSHKQRNLSGLLALAKIRHHFKLGLSIVCLFSLKSVSQLSAKTVILMLQGSFQYLSTGFWLCCSFNGSVIPLLYKWSEGKVCLYKWALITDQLNKRVIMYLFDLLRFFFFKFTFARITIYWLWAAWCNAWWLVLHLKFAWRAVTPPLPSLHHARTQDTKMPNEWTRGFQGSRTYSLKQPFFCEHNNWALHFKMVCAFRFWSALLTLIPSGYFCLFSGQPMKPPVETRNSAITWLQRAT